MTREFLWQIYTLGRLARVEVLVMVLASVLVLVASGPAQAETRVALVIGNSNYSHVNKLPNPRNDATDIADTLQKLGFDVFQGTDLTYAGFDQILTQFREALVDADVALMFYAGHGVQVGGINYLIPVDAQFETVRDLTEGAISLRKIQGLMQSRPRLSLLFFDACRNNPFLRKLSRSLEGRNAGVQQGWATVSPRRGAYISFASAEGRTAADGEGRNSPFSKALLKHIATPGLDVQLMMRDVRQNVITATRGRQVPWEKASLVASFMFAPGRRAVGGGGQLQDVSQAAALAGFSIKADKRRYSRNGQVRLTVTTPIACRLTLVSTDTKGQSCLLFPYQKRADKVLRAGETFTFPPRGALRLPDAGEETFIAMCNASKAALNARSRSPRKTICSRGGPDPNVNDRLNEIATFDPDAPAENDADSPSPDTASKQKQFMLRDSVTVTVE